MRRNRNYWTKEKAFQTALKFNNKRDFVKYSSAAYELLRKNGWLEEACSHMKNPSIKWDFIKCKNEALKYKTKKDFKKKCSWGYYVAKQNNWISEICLHMVKYRTPIKWTYDRCKEEALKYNKRIDFNRKSSKAYAACIRNNWLDELCLHMISQYESRFKWSKELCHEIALKYKYRKEFQNNDNKAYSSAMYNGWLDDICLHMKYKKLPNRYWHSYENCKNEALKYKTKTEFIRNSQHAYNVSLKNGWLNDITEHMIKIGDRYNKCIYSYEFSDNYVYVGLTYNMAVREKSRKYNINDSVTKHINKTNLIPILKQLTDYIFVNDAIVLEEKYLNEYIIDGWIPLNKCKTGGIGSSSPVWNLNRIKKIIKKYDSLISFKNDDIELYTIAKRSGWIDSLFPDEI